VTESGYINISGESARGGERGRREEERESREKLITEAKTVKCRILCSSSISDLKEERRGYKGRGKSEVKSCLWLKTLSLCLAD
jgi:hypothetical protein